MSKALRWAALLVATSLLCLFVWRQSQEWRGEQRLFQTLEKLRLRELLDAEVENNRESVEALESRLREERQSLKQEAGALDPVRRELRQLDKKIRSASARERSLSQGLEKGQTDGRIDSEARSQLRLARVERESLASLRGVQAHRLEVLTADLRALEVELSSARAAEFELAAALDQVGRRGLLGRLPLPRGLDASLEVREIEPPGLYRGVAKQRSPRVDRCVTCHWVADREGYEDVHWPEPLRSHPRLDLFMGAESPHPLARFGCTICHGGEGEATSFDQAGHGGEILSGAATEPSCLECHGDRAPLAGTRRLRSGQTLIDRLGCRSCHRIDHPAFTEPPPAAPPLGALASKTTQEWVAAWLASPRDYRPTTWMPHFFPSQSLEEWEGRKQRVEIRGIVAYLWRGVGRPGPQIPEGDPGVGKRLFESVGCTACHLRDAGAERGVGGADLQRLRGPNLARLGAKVQSSWLYSWLRDPKAYDAAASMPNLRLSEKEAADLSAFLMSGGDWSAPPLPAVDLEARDALTLSLLEGSNTIERSERLLAEMDGVEKESFIGRAAIERLGCHGCHAIPGFEKARPAASELSTLAARPLPRKLPGEAAESSLSERERWLRGSLAHSATLDYGLGPEEVDAVVTVLLGLRTPTTAPERRYLSGPDGAGLARGFGLLEHYGCRACHRLEGANPGSVPKQSLPSVPSLEGAGQRLRAEWIFHFLGDPGGRPVRTWAQARMPTYDLDGEERNALAAFFALRAGEPFLGSPPPSPPADSVLIGEVVFRLLQCDRCHGEEGQAPPYRLASGRLRHEWVEQWLLDPARFRPQSSMPRLFARESSGFDSTFLVDMLGTPIFFDLRSKLHRGLGSAEAVEARLSDPEAVARALRDYLWSLE